MRGPRRHRPKGTGVRIGLATILIGVAAGLGAPGRADAETLFEILAKTYENNPTLAAERAKLRATDEQVPQAVSGWRPTVTFTGDIGKRHLETSRSIPPTLVDNVNITPRSATLQVTQPLFTGGRVPARIRQAENVVESARARLTAVEQQVLLDAVTAYMDVVRDTAVLELNRSNEQVLTRQLEATRDRFEVGEVTRTDVSQAEARLARARADRIRAEANLEASRAAYRNIVGSDPVDLVSPGAPPNLPASRDEALSRAATNNPNVRSAEFVERAAKDNVDAVTAELLPSISLNGVLSKRLEQSSKRDDTEEVTVTARITVPIYQQGAVYSRVREAKQQQGQRRIEIETARRAAIQEATRAWEELLAARARIRQFESEVEANAIALEGTEQEARAGLRIVLDILDAEQELLDARVNLVRARRDEIVAGYQVLAATGDLTAKALGLGVSYYEPEEHYRAVRDKLFGTDVRQKVFGISVP